MELDFVQVGSPGGVPLPVYPPSNLIRPVKTAVGDDWSDPDDRTRVHRIFAPVFCVGWKQWLFLSPRDGESLQSLLGDTAPG